MHRCIIFKTTKLRRGEFISASLHHLRTTKLRRFFFPSASQHHLLCNEEIYSHHLLYREEIFSHHFHCNKGRDIFASSAVQRKNILASSAVQGMDIFDSQGRYALSKRLLRIIKSGSPARIGPVGDAQKQASTSWPCARSAWHITISQCSSCFWSASASGFSGRDRQRSTCDFLSAFVRILAGKSSVHARWCMRMADMYKGITPFARLLHSCIPSAHGRSALYRHLSV